MGTQRAGRWGVNEAGVPRVLYAVHDRSVAVVGVGPRYFALERVQRPVGARTAAHNLQSRCLRPRCDIARRGCQRPTAGLAGLTGGRRGVAFYMVRHIPSRSSLQERESSCIGAHRGQHRTIAARKKARRPDRAQYGTAEPAVSNTQPRGECVSRYLTRFGRTLGSSKGRYSHMPLTSRTASSASGEIDCDPSGVAQDMYSASEGSRRLSSMSLDVDEIGRPVPD